MVYTEIAREIPSAWIYGEHYTESNGAVRTAIQKYLLGSASAADALKEAADLIRQNTGLQ